ncbi:MAG: putative amidophosphoribosyltransferase [Planctomycetota bacterium]|jgi:predicted amidophosphoribosyltransferase
MQCLRRALDELLEFLYPAGCRLCAAEPEDAAGLACAQHALPAGLPGPRCGKCCAALPPMLPHGRTCAPCKRRPLGLARVLALADYRADAGAREWLLALKHGGRSDLAPILGALLGQALAQAPPLGQQTPVLVPVPLHPWRLLERGYNQADGLAQGAGSTCHWPVHSLLERVRPTPPQGALGSPQRRANVADAFRAVPRRARRLAGRPVWLVDDVSTSGATAQAAARALRRAGLGPVGLAVIAVAREAG